MSLLDTACARVAISQHAVPPQLEDCRARIEALETELGIIGREEAVGVNAADAASRVRGEAGGEEASARRAGEALEEEHKLVERLLEIRAKLRQAADQSTASGSTPAQASGDKGRRRAMPTAAEAVTPRSATQLLGELRRGCRRSCRRLQGESPLILPSVDEQAVAAVVAGLDRRAGRPHGQERSGDRCSTSPTRSISASSASAMRST